MNLSVLRPGLPRGHGVRPLALRYHRIAPEYSPATTVVASRPRHAVVAVILFMTIYQVLAFAILHADV